jgi:hypothetical protein
METKTIEKKGRKLTMERPDEKHSFKITKNEPLVPPKKLSLKEALKVHRKRSKMARNQDRKKTSKSVITDDRWAKNPGKHDYPGVDTEKIPVAKFAKLRHRGKEAKEQLTQKKAAKKPSLKNRIHYAFDSWDRSISNYKAKKMGYGTYENKAKLKQMGFSWNGNHWEKEKISAAEEKQLAILGIKAEEPVMPKTFKPNLNEAHIESGPMFRSKLRPEVEVYPYDEYVKDVEEYHRKRNEEFRKKRGLNV